jgi:hypothetical protein
MAALVLDLVALTAVVLSFRLAALVVMQRAAEPKPTPPTTASDDPGGTAATMARVLAEIEHLAALRDRGALTEKEFVAQKTRLLRERV